MMTKLQREVRRFCTDENGATAIEYAMIAAGIGVVIVAAVNSIGSAVKGSFTAAQNGFN